MDLKIFCHHVLSLPADFMKGPRRLLFSKPIASLPQALSNCKEPGHVEDWSFAYRSMKVRNLVLYITAKLTSDFQTTLA